MNIHRCWIKWTNSKSKLKFCTLVKQTSCISPSWIFSACVFFICSGVGVCILWLAMSRESERFVHMLNVTDAFFIHLLNTQYNIEMSNVVLNETLCVFWREQYFGKWFIWQKWNFYAEIFVSLTVLLQHFII